MCSCREAFMTQEQNHDIILEEHRRTKELKMKIDQIDNYNTEIDLPEEYPLISKDPQKPDTLIAYYKDNKLFFRFPVTNKNP